MASNFGFSPGAVAAPSPLVSLTTGTTLTGVSYGNTYYVTGAGGFNVYLPSLSVSFAGFSSSLTIINDSSSAIIVAASGSNSIRFIGSTLTSITVPVGEVLKLVNAVNYWVADSALAKVSASGATFTGAVVLADVASTDNTNKAVYSKWVKDLLTSRAYATIDSPSFTGTPLTVTPAQFSHTSASTNKVIVNAEYLAAAAQQFGGVVPVTSTTALTNASYGKLITFSGTTASTITLPAVTNTTSSAGQTIRIVNASTTAGTALTIALGSGTSDIRTNGQVLTTLTMFPGAVVDLAQSGTSWYNTAPSSYLSVVSSSSGWIRFDSGLIWQFGTTSAATNATLTGFAFPITFPNGVLCALGNKTFSQAGATEGNSAGITATSTSTYSVWADDTGGAVAWFAVGY